MTKRTIWWIGTLSVWFFVLSEGLPGVIALLFWAIALALVEPYAAKIVDAIFPKKESPDR